MSDRPDLLENLGSPEAVARAEKIAELNDDLRRCILMSTNLSKSKHQTVLFMGDMGAEIGNMETLDRIRAQMQIARLVQNPADPFTADNDAWGERDKGWFTWNGERCMWTISYYDLPREAHSPDETDPSVTHRALTIFYTRDY